MMLKKLQTIVIVVIGSTLLVILSTCLTSLYAPKSQSKEAIYKTIQNQYQEVAIELGFQKDFFSSLVSKKDIEKGINGTHVQERVKQRLQEAKQSSIYVMDTDMISKISAIMKERYDSMCYTYDTKSVLDQVRVYCLYIVLGSSVLLVIITLMDKKGMRKR